MPNEIDLLHTRGCFNNHMGEWMIEPKWLNKAVSAIQSGLWRADPKAFFDDDEEENRGGRLFVTQDGVAVIPIMGAIQKGFSKHGGTSSIHTRMLVRQAVANAKVKSILIHIDSPGGTVAGTDELAEEIRIAGKSKLVHAHIDDLGASAALWIASAASHISSNKMGHIGSIGVVVVIADTSEAAKMQGVKVHVISTGDHKGAFAPGVEITEEQLAEMQQTVDGINVHFIKAISNGRGLTIPQVRKLADGRVHIAQKALELGLIDSIGSVANAVVFLSKSDNDKRKNSGRAMMADELESSKIESELKKTYLSKSEILKRKIKIHMDDVSKT